MATLAAEVYFGLARKERFRGKERSLPRVFAGAGLVLFLLEYLTASLTSAHRRSRVAGRGVIPLKPYETKSIAAFLVGPVRDFLWVRVLPLNMISSEGEINSLEKENSILYFVMREGLSIMSQISCLTAAGEPARPSVPKRNMENQVCAPYRLGAWRIFPSELTILRPLSIL